MSMRQLIEKIESGFGRVWDREMSRKDKWRVENKKTELGHYQIGYGNTALKDTLIELGYDSVDEVSEKEIRLFLEVLRQNRKDGNIVALIDWHASGKKTGFGNMVMRRIFEIADKINAKKMRVFLPSYKADEILDHYVKRGILSRISKNLYGLRDKSKILS